VRSAAGTDRDDLELLAAAITPATSARPATGTDRRADQAVIADGAVFRARRPPPADDPATTPRQPACAAALPPAM
jgi:hypothetical protein